MTAGLVVDGVSDLGDAAGFHRLGVRGVDSAARPQCGVLPAGDAAAHATTVCTATIPTSSTAARCRAPIAAAAPITVAVASAAAATSAAVGTKTAAAAPGHRRGG